VSTANHTTWIWRGLFSLVVLAVLAFTLHAIVFSGASFTAGSVNPGAEFATGILAHTNDQGDAFAIDAGGLVPGTSKAGTMTLQGSGTLPARFTLESSDLEDLPASPAISTVLRLTIEDVTATPVTLYEGAVADLSTADLGTIAPDASRTYRLTLTYPAGPNRAELQGATMTLALAVTGVTS
jgi:hypothetical protein